MKRRPAQLLTIPTTAERLACSVRTVWQLVATGKLSSVKIGPRSTRIDEDELERFIEDARRRNAR